MNIKSHNIVVQRTARYFALEEGASKVEDVLIVLHGYGMHAGLFLKEFTPIVRDGLLVVAPEGLSRFYRKGFDGDVVATWMTREDRLSEIADQRFFLDSLYDELMANYSPRFHVLGFSQGTATASRWMVGNSRRFHRLILWGGDFAPDAEGSILGVEKIQCVVGNQDPFIPIDIFDERCIALENKGFVVQRHVFDGKHEIPGTVLVNVWSGSVNGD
ncbi:MAG: alpha/beta hydrolase [Bacteroidota bacterium]|jgi:predicted esterase